MTVEEVNSCSSVAYWSPLAPLVEPELLQKEAARFWAAIEDNGLIPSPYPTLPWWDSIFTLDGLIALRRLHFI